MTQFVDWDLATATARTLGRSGPAIGLEDATEVVNQLREIADTATAHVAEFTGMTTDARPPIRVVDRAGWTAANVEGMRLVMDPLARKVSGEPGALSRAVGSRVAGAQAGAVLGYLSGKVLGQFEVFSGATGQLLLVAPNIVETERQLSVEPDHFRMWLCLHEATHAAQFGAVPWLRDHFLSELDSFATAGSGEGVDLTERARRVLAMLADSVRDTDGGTSVVDLVTSPQQRAVMDRLTAMMTLLEGHADYVMDRVAPQLIPDVTKLRARFNKRRESGGPLQRLARRMLGMDVKLRQYVQGMKFVDAVVSKVGMERFNLVWASADNLPTITDIDDPDAWIDRVAA